MIKLFNYFKSASKVIAEIHDEFDTAGDKLLAEAKSILSGEIDTSKADRLMALGFTKAASVGKVKELKEQQIALRELAEAIEYYRVYYPNNKFISKDAVEVICGKYGLLCGEIARYKGDVPLKNISEMEVFSLRKEDMEKHSSYDRYIEWGYHNRMLGSFIGRTVVSRTPTMDELDRMRTQMHYSRPAFLICAPEKDFDMDRAEKKGFFIKDVPDPIVLQPVNFGF